MAPDGRRATARSSRETTGLLVLTFVFLLAMGGIGAAMYVRMPGFRGESPKSHIAAGQARANVGDLSGAMEHLGKAIASDPDAAAPYVARADVHFRFGDHRAAIADYTAAIERDADDGRPYVGRARARQARGDIDLAIADYTVLIERDPDRATLWRRRGQLRRLAEAWDDALADLTRARELNPGLRRLDSDLAWAQWAVVDYEAALDSFDRAVDRAETLHEAFGRGVTLYHLGLLVEAHADLIAAGTRRGSGSDYAQYYLWLARARLGDREGAHAGLRAFLDAPDRGALRPWSQRIAAFLLGESDESQLLEEAASGQWLSAEAQLCEACFYAGTVRLIAGDEDKAADLFEKAVETGQVNYYEYYSARAELARLGNQ